MTTLEKQLNIWSVQEQLYALSSQNQLEINLKVHRDRYINQLIIENLRLKKGDSEPKNILCPPEKNKLCIIL
jgi:hypothetical protein